MKPIRRNSSPMLIPATICFALTLVLGALPAWAQHHAMGAAWIQRDAPEATQVHLSDDPLCFVEFQERCFGGMMAPDSVLCEVGPLAEEDWPEQCPIAIDCWVSGPDGQPMLDGTGMHGGMMRSDVHVTVHYPQDRISELGLDPTQLCLAVWNGSRWTIESDAIHDPDSSRFTLSTQAPTARYAVLPLSAVRSAQMSWGGLKTLY